jgi:tRNA(Ile)-lysidine synthase
MPVVETAWPGGVAALARFADTSASDERMLSGLALEARSTVIRIAADGVELNRPGLAALDEAVARRVVRDALELAGGSPVFREVQAVWRLAHSARVRSSVDLHRLRAQRDGDQIRLRRPLAFPTVSGFTYLLNLPGEVQIVETGASVRASLLSGPDIPALSDGWDAMAALQASTVATPLTVRTRLAGDRLLPLGAPGSRTLQNLLVDRKISRDARATLPVVVDADGQIVWVAGVAQSDHCRVRTPLSGVVILEFKKGTL